MRGTLKSFITGLLIVLLAVPAFASPRLLKQWLADPQAIIVGTDLWITGTYGTGNSDVEIHRVALSNIDLPNVASYVQENYKVYVPDSFYPTDYWAGSMGAELFREPGGSVGLFWGSLYNPAPSWTGIYTTFYAQKPNGSDTFSGPYYINYGSTTYPHTHPVEQGNDTATERKRIRIDATVFYDDANGTLETTDPMWVFYNYFCEGNQIAGWLKAGTGSPTTAIDFQRAASPDKTDIVEGACVFKRGSWYYMIYSHGDWESNYSLMYKKATTVAGLATATSTSITSLSGVWNNLRQEWGYPKNAGHCGVFQANGKYYIVYHVGRPSGGNTYLYKACGYCARDTYIDTLTFYPTGNIMALTLPN